LILAIRIEDGNLLEFAALSKKLNKEQEDEECDATKLIVVQ